MCIAIDHLPYFSPYFANVTHGVVVGMMLPIIGVRGGPGMAGPLRVKYRLMTKRKRAAKAKTVTVLFMATNERKEGNSKREHPTIATRF